MIKLKKLLGEGEDKQSPKQTLSNEARRHFLEIISTYGSFGPKLKSENDLAQIAETLGAITDAASEFANKEAGNHFDEATVKRNMNELGKLSAQFEKIANEAKSLHSQMENLYEDMGHIIGRYYGVSELSEEEVNQRLGIRSEDLVGNQHKLDVDGDGDIGADDLADLRAGKKVNEAKVFVHNEKTGEKHEVLSGKGKGDLMIAMKALQNAAPSHMKYSIKESVNEANDLKVYHKSYTEAIQTAKEYALKRGYMVDEDDSFRKIGMGPKRPSEGKTNKVSVELTKGGKPTNKQLHIQVYGMKNGYELNCYIN